MKLEFGGAKSLGNGGGHRNRCLPSRSQGFRITTPGPQVTASRLSSDHATESGVVGPMYRPCVSSWGHIGPTTPACTVHAVSLLLETL